MNNAKKNIEQLDHHPVIQELMAHKEKLNIDVVAYERYYGENIEYYCTLDDMSIIQEFYHDTSSQPAVMINPEIEVLSWSDYCSDRIIKLYNKNLNLGNNGCGVMLRHKNFAEKFAFGSMSMNVDLVEYFTRHKTQKNKLINIVRKHLQLKNMHNHTTGIHYPSIKKYLSNEHDKYLEIKEGERFYIYGNNGHTYLTCKEMSCLQLTLRLKTAVQIGEKLDISHKTVELYLSNIKTKLGIQARHELYLIARKNQII